MSGSKQSEVHLGSRNAASPLALRNKIPITSDQNRVFKWVPAGGEQVLSEQREGVAQFLP